jgi:hypothetical protein
MFFGSQFVAAVVRLNFLAVTGQTILYLSRLPLPVSTVPRCRSVIINWANRRVRLALFVAVIDP